MYTGKLKRDTVVNLSSSQHRVETLREAVRSLGDIAQVLKHRRAQDGAVELDSVEVKVQINEENQDTTQIENLIPKQVCTMCILLPNMFALGLHVTG